MQNEQQRVGSDVRPQLVSQSVTRPIFAAANAPPQSASPPTSGAPPGTRAQVITQSPQQTQSLSTKQPTYLFSVPSPQATGAGVLSSKKEVLRYVLIGAVVVMAFAAAIAWLVMRMQQPAVVTAADYKTASIPLDTFAGNDANGQAPTLQINGNLYVKDSVVLAPSDQPLNPTMGQLYYDKTANQLSYFNGQSFIGVGNGAGTGSSVTYVQSSQNSVTLQAAAPGVQQTGSFNISGTGQMGTLKTNIIDNAGGYLFVGPVGATPQPYIPPGTPATAGLTTLGALTTSPTPINGTFIATKATVGNVGGTASSITVYIEGGTAGKHIQVALYDDDGSITGRPSAQLALSASTLLTPNAFNTITIPTTELAPNTAYWMAFNTDDTTVARRYDGLGRASCFYGVGYGYMPNPFGGCYYSNELYTMYINYKTAASGGGTTGQALFTLGPTGKAVFRNSEDSTTAFQIQNAYATKTLFNVDTINSRVAIGKATANYMLDIAGGDINLSSNRAIFFGGSQTLTVTTGTSYPSTILSNLTTNGSVIMQGDNFVVQDSGGAHQNMAIGTNGQATFSNRVDSIAAFSVQNANGAALFTADTSNMRVYVGSATASNTPVLLYLANKNTAGDPVGGEGAMYYNGTLASFRCYRSGAWHDCADIEPQHNYSVYDEFMGGQTTFTGMIGNLGWSAAAIGAHGSLALNPATPAPSADRPGVLRIRTPAVANQGSTLYLGEGSGAMRLAAGNGVKTAVAVGATTDQVLRVGLHTQTTATTQPVSGVWWEADPAANANWRYCYGDGASAVCAASTVAIAANSWATLEIRIVATGAGVSNIYFVINNMPYQVMNATLDTATQVSPALSAYTTTAAARDSFWDYFQLTGTTSAMR